MSKHQCLFAHHWIPDTSDVFDEESLNLENAFHVLLKEDGPIILITFLFIVTLFVATIKRALKLIYPAVKQKKS